MFPQKSQDWELLNSLSHIDVPRPIIAVTKRWKKWINQSWISPRHQIWDRQAWFTERCQGKSGEPDISRREEHECKANKGHCSSLSIYICLFGWPHFMSHSRCSVMNENGPRRLIHLNAWSSVSRRFVTGESFQKLTPGPAPPSLPLSQDVKHSAAAPVPCLSASHDDHHEPTLWNCKPDPS